MLLVVHTCDIAPQTATRPNIFMFLRTVWENSPPTWKPEVKRE